jgi:hypothetical protein
MIQVPEALWNLSGHQHIQDVGVLSTKGVFDGFFFAKGAGF